MNVLTIDFETYYTSTDLGFKTQTTEEYIRDKRFEVVGVSVQVGDGAPEWFSGTKGATKEWLLQFDWANSMALAHNAIFDMAILNWHFGIKPKAIADTLSMARAIHGTEVGNSLAKMAAHYKLGVKGTEVVNAINLKREDFSADQLAKYGEYCCNDVALTYDLFLHLLPRLTKGELKLIDLTIRMFTEPVLRLDSELLKSHLVAVRGRKEELIAAAGATVDDLMSNQKFAELLRGLGVVPPTKISTTTGKETLALAKNDEEFKALADHPDERVQALVAARLGNKSTLEETRTERLLGIAERGLIPVPLSYYAAHTGRWGGADKLNFQNLPSRGPNAGTLKKSILAPEGYVIGDCDSSQIEARVLAWFAGQDDLVEFFEKNNGEIAAGVKKKDMKYDPYKIMAAAIYQEEVLDITDPQRFVGKTTVLGCFGADTLVLTDHGWKRIVEVQSTDKVWDGEEWVTHMGVVPKGERETIRAWGVNATPEHEILTEHGWREWYAVVTNPFLSQSAFSKAHSLSLVGSSTSGQLVDQPDGIHTSDARVVGKVSLTATTSKQGELLGVTPVEKLRHIPSGTGRTSRFSRMKRTAQGCLIASHRAFHDVITLAQRCIHTMVGGGSLCIPHGALTGWRFSNTYSPSRAGMTLNATLTESTTVKGTNPVICDSQHAVKMRGINDQSGCYKQRLQTYDIAYAGPRNRFTIATDAGELIVHNCGYGMGAIKFQAQLKAFGVEIALEEAQRIISVYRETYPWIPALWKSGNVAIEAMAKGRTANWGKKGVIQITSEGIRMPNGMHQRYPGLRKVKDKDGKEQYIYDSRKGVTKLYGGKLTENICQGLARCIIGEQMLLIAKRYKVVMTVHDAVAWIAPESEAQESLEYVMQCMRHVPDWAQGIPLNCEAGYGKSYGDC